MGLQLVNPFRVSLVNGSHCISRSDGKKVRTLKKGLLELRELVFRFRLAW